MYLCPKECENYYRAQAGAGSDYFRGIAYQRGYGFFGDLRRYITPMLFRTGRYLGKNLFQAGKNVMEDVVSGKGFKQSARSRLGETSAKIRKDIFERLQRGEGGIKRKRRTNPRQTRVKRRKISRDIFD